MKADRIDLGLTGYDELFMSTEERLDTKKPKVDELPLDELKPFKDHPFKVIGDEEMERLKDSIRESGVLIPALARPAENGYELISGHRRLAACRALGLSTMPVIVRNLTDEEAVIAMVDSNLQREHILPSEKAFAYKMKYEAMKRQGKRNDLTSSQLGKKLWADEQLAKDVGESRNQVHRFLRLAEVIPCILDLVDKKVLAVVTAVEVSYLDSEVQEMLYEYMMENDICKAFQLYALRDYMKEHETITKMELMRILNENAPKDESNRFQQLTITKKKLQEYFPTFYTKSQMEKVLFSLLEEWREKNSGKEA